MTAPAQRATLVLEHASAADDDHHHEEIEDPWSVVAYLIYDNGMRKRATLCRHSTREDAAVALEKVWGTISG